MDIEVKAEEDGTGIDNGDSEEIKS
jgi:hypothetical protein